MGSKLGFSLIGGFVGLFIGSSLGVSGNGGAVNGAWVFAPIGAVIGFLVAQSKTREPEDNNRSEETAKNETSAPDRQLDQRPQIRVVWDAQAIIRMVAALFAFLWNIHVELLDRLFLLDIFEKKPWLFSIVAIVNTLIFPPLILVYGASFFAARHFGMSPETQYRAKIS